MERNWQCQASSCSGWHQDVELEDLNQFIQQINRFNLGEVASGISPSAASVGIAASVEHLVVSGFTKGAPQDFADLSLACRLIVPTTSENLLLEIENLAWSSLALNGQVAIPPVGIAGVANEDLTIQWQAKPIDLPTIVPELQTFLPQSETPPPEEIAVWLEANPVKAGTLEARGELQLPWPLPSDITAEMVLPEVVVSAHLTDCEVALPQATGTLQISADIQLSDSDLKLSSVSFVEVEGGFGGTGNITAPLPGSPGPVQIRLVGNLDLADMWKKFEPVLPATRSGVPLPNLAGQAHWQINADIKDPPSLTEKDGWLTALAAGEILGITLGATVEDLTLDGEIPGAPWHLTSLELKSDAITATADVAGLDHVAVSGSATVHLSEFMTNPLWGLNLDLRHLDLDHLAVLFSTPVETAFNGHNSTLGERLLSALATPVRAAPAVAIAPGEMIPADLILDFRGRTENVILQKASYSDVQVEGRLADRVVDVNSLVAKRSTGKISGRGTIDYVVDPYGQLVFTVEAVEVPTAALLAPYVPGLAPLWEGNMSTVIDGECGLKNSEQVRSSLTLTGNASSTYGVFHAQGLLAGVSQFLGDRQDLQDIRFDKLFQRFQVTDGRFLVQDLIATGPDTDWLANGWVGLDGSIDLGLSVKLPSGYTPDLGKFSFFAEGFREADGRMKLDFRLTGQAGKPVVSLDFEQAKQKFQSDLDGNVKKGVRGLLNKLKRK